MSNLSSLLNPTQSSTETTPSKVQQLPPLQLDGQDHRSRHHQLDNRDAQSPTQRIVTSPGLDALATAASTTAPLMSPTQQQSSMAQVIYQDNIQKSSELENIASNSPASRVLSNLVPQQQFSGLKPHGQPTMDHSLRMPDHREDPSRNLADLPETLPALSNAPAVTDSTFNLHSDQRHDRWPAESSHDDELAQLPLDQTLKREPQVSDLVTAPTDSTRSQNEPVKVKAELTETLGMKNGAPARTDSLGSVSQDHTPGTPLKNVISNVSPDPATQIEGSTSTLPKPKLAPSKKRPGPKKSTAAKPPAKKRRVGTESGKASPRTGTPATSRASGTPGPKKGKQDSATPTRSSSVMNAEDDEDDGEPELFCICRKPDDHTVMIGCDGPCEDWFHTRCVNMTNEKVALISKWYCPNCAAEGHETEWKRMCRLESCSKPALTDGPHRSKYCCKGHGLEFIERRLFADEKKLGGSNAMKRRRRDNYTDHDGFEPDENEEQPDNRGGVLRPGELKALVDGVENVATFKKLGDGVLSPPETAATSPEREAWKRIVCNSEEAQSLDKIGKQRADIEARKDMLSDRETLVHMVERRRKDVLTRLKEKEKSLKDICGFDARLTWSDEELNEWRNSKEGRDQLQKNMLNADPKLTKSLDAANGGEGDEAEVGPGVCKKKRCERHRTWYKVQQQDNAMEREHVRQQLKKLDEEEKGVKERAMIRNLEEG